MCDVIPGISMNEAISTSRWTPTNGQTVNLPNFSTPGHTAFLDPAGTLLTLTINMPDTPQNGQVVRIVTSKLLTVLLLTAPLGVLLGAVTTLALNGFLAFAWDSVSQQWFRAT